MMSFFFFSNVRKGAKWGSGHKLRKIKVIDHKLQNAVVPHSYKQVLYNDPLSSSSAILYQIYCV